MYISPNITAKIFKVYRNGNISCWYYVHYQQVLSQEEMQSIQFHVLVLKSVF